MKHSLTYHDDVPRETFEATEELYQANSDALSTYIDQLFWWNDRINLISRDVSRETIVSHIRHSLLLTYFSEFKKAKQVVDAGTGGGLPGIPLAITNTDKRYILNDIVSKKTMAVKQMAHKQQLSNVETSDQSVAKITLGAPFLLISKHAFKINNLITLTADQPWTQIILYKGLPFEDELNNITQELKISVHNLSKNSGNKFYEDKAILIISR